MTSARSVGTVLAAQILGRLGVPHRFDFLAGIRSFSELVSRLDFSGLTRRHNGLAKAGDACLREALYMSAEHTRSSGPTLGAKYHRFMVHGRKHHISARATSPPPCSPASPPASAAAKHYQLVISTAELSPRPKHGPSSSSAYNISAEPRTARRTLHTQRARPAKDGVATRPIDRSVHPEDDDPRRSLTAIWA